MSQPVSDDEEQDLDGQYRRPFGEVGRRIGREMARDHLPENLWTIEQLDPQPGDCVLEVGFGPGVAVEELLERARVGFVAGIDFSETMVEEASRRNAEAIEAGRADLRYGEAGELPFDDGSFDRAFSIHSVYFWSRPRQAFTELWRVLRPGGLLVITMLSKDRWPPNAPGSELEFGTPECTPYYGSEIEQMMLEAGFSRAWVVVDEEVARGGAASKRSNFSVLGRK